MFFGEYSKKEIAMITKLKWIKLALTGIFSECIFGKICFEYGFAKSGSPEGIVWFYLLLAYALVLIVVSSFTVSKADYELLKPNIVSLCLVAIPNIAILIIALCNKVIEREMSFFIAYCVIVSVTLICDIVMTVFSVRERHR